MVWIQFYNIVFSGEIGTLSARIMRYRVIDGLWTLHFQTSLHTPKIITSGLAPI